MRTGVRLLDRYVTQEFLRIFLITAIGFPLFTIVINLADSVDKYLSRHLPLKTIAYSYVFYLPEQIFFIIPAAVLFATVFTMGAFSRHSEITAAKASGVSFHRLAIPVFILAALASVLTYGLGEIAPRANEKRAEVLGEKQIHSTTARFNFVYRADGGRTYSIRSLTVPDSSMVDVQIEREGTGPEFPGYFLTAQRGIWSTRHGWTLHQGALRMFMGPTQELDMQFDSLRQRALTEKPVDLLTEPKSPDEMTYGELGHYVETLRRSGGDAKKLQVEQALKLAIPVTCLIIALFGAPLGLTGARSGAAYGVAVSLATTIIFLVLVQVSKAVGAGGIVPPLVAAWFPNALFGAFGLWLYAKART